MFGKCGTLSFRKIAPMENEIRPKMPFVIDGSEPKLNFCSACVEIARDEVSGKSLQWKPRYSRRDTFSSM
jgi:hypothetical protein